MNETKHLDYTLSEIDTLIEENIMRINVVRSNNNIPIDDRVEIENKLQRKNDLLLFSKNKPYFSRIDFKSDNGTDICYIGKNGIINSDNKVIVVDWRAPISSVYYDSNIGKTSYKVNDEIVEGELLLKRQYDIQNSKLISYYDVDIVSNDDILKQYLNVNSDNRLKNIVSTIQSEQNEIIRMPINKSILVQGVAGSGKTTVALHRIAYLAYSYKDHINPNQYMIIGPNKFFINYISSVLPELDVDDVKQFDFIDFTKYILKENFNYNETIDDENTYYKTSMKFKKIIDKYVNYLDKTILPNKNLEMFGFKILDKYEIQNVYDNVKNDFDNLSLKVDKSILLLEKIIQNKKENIIINANNYIDNKFVNANEKEKNILKKQREDIKKEVQNNCHNILKKYFNYVNENVTLLYKKIFKNINIYHEDNINLNCKNINFGDLTGLLYLYYKIHGNNNYQIYRQIVIDEAQDYNEFTYYTLTLLFKNASFSIFGDIAQSIFPYRSIENWDILKEKIMDVSILYLSKSYRTSIEIMNEANKINRYLSLNEAIPVIRHGKIPEYYKIDSYEFILNKILELKEKYKSIAIISKNDKDSKDIYSFLKDKIKINLITDESNEYNGGICSLTSTLSKGLEFDAVIINKADNNIFDINNRTDMKLLYVSMTRALHELIVTYENNLVNILK